MKHFYVTVIRGEKVGWLFGPIADHDVARSFVPAIRKIAESIDPRCVFDAFGTSSITADEPPSKGVLNDHWDKFSA